ncbi:hypothetical protein BGX20_008143, partial [Mortierella sp. AD010]
MALDQEQPRRDEQIVPPAVTELFTPSDNGRGRCHRIWPSDPRSFFRRKVSNDEWNNGLRQYLKNTALSKITTVSSPGYSATSLISRDRLTISSTASDIPEESEELLVSFANLIREQLKLLAAKVNTVRTENLRKDRGLSTSDASNMLIDPHASNEEIKTAKALAAAFAPSKANQNNNGGR